MSVKLLYFAWVREKTGLGEEMVDVPDGIATIADLIGWLKRAAPNMQPPSSNPASSAPP